MNKILKIPLQREIKKDVFEIELAKDSVKGNADAYTKLVKIHKEYLYKIAYSYAKDEQKALDILQETIYKGLLNIKRLSKPNFFKTWITKILINISIDYVKQDSKEIYFTDDISLVDNPKSITVEERLDLYDAIDRLRDTYKMVIILKYFNDMSDEEIALSVAMNINTVKSHLRRAKKELKDILKEDNLNEK